MHVKKEALALHMLPHSVNKPNAARGMVFSSLQNYNSNISNKTNQSTQVNKLLNDILAKGSTKKVVFEIFEEVELKIIETNRIKRNNKIICHTTVLEEVL